MQEKYQNYVDCRIHYFDDWTCVPIITANTVNIRICFGKNYWESFREIIIQMSVSVVQSAPVTRCSSCHPNIWRSWRSSPDIYCSWSTSVRQHKSRTCITDDDHHITKPRNNPGNVLTWSISLHTCRQVPSDRPCCHRSPWSCCTHTEADWGAGVQSRREAGGCLDWGPGRPGWPGTPPSSSSSARKSCLRLRRWGVARQEIRAGEEGVHITTENSAWLR